MNADKRVPLIDAFQWFVIPHGINPKTRMARVTIRVLPQIPKAALKKGRSTPLCVRDLDPGFDAQGVAAIRDWPGFVSANLESMTVAFDDAKTPPISVTAAQLQNALEAGRARHGASLRLAQRLWCGLVYDALVVEPTASDLGSVAQRAQAGPTFLSALNHAQGAELLRNTIGQMYATRLGDAANVRKNAGGGSDSLHGAIAGVETIHLRHEQLKALGGLLDLYSTNTPSAPPDDVKVRDESATQAWVFSRLGMERVREGERETMLLRSNPYGLSKSGLRAIINRVNNWDIRQENGEPPRERSEVNNLAHFALDRILAMAPESGGGTPDKSEMNGPQAAAQEPVFEDSPPDFHKQIASIAFHAWLMDILGLAIDLEIPVDHLPMGETVGMFATDIRLKGEQPVPVLPSLQMRVMTRMYDMETKAPVFFPAEEGGAANWKHWNGCVKLDRNVVVNPGEEPKLEKPEYVLEQLDIDSCTEKLTQVACADRSQFEAGIIASKRSAVLAPLPTTGISLLVRRPAEKAAGDNNRTRKRQAQCAANGGIFEVYASDLIIGYRPDIAVLEIDKRGASCVRPFRTLVGRTLESAEASGMDVLPEFRTRPQDEGLIAPIARTPPPKNKKEEDRPPLLLLYEELFRWRGWNLVVPPVEAASGSAPAAATQESRLRLSYRSAGLLPMQRIGSGYRVGLRVVYADGKSIPLDEAARVYADVKAGCTVGTDTIGVPREDQKVDPKDRVIAFLPFFRNEPIAIPDVHLTRRPSRVTVRSERADNLLVASSGRGEITVATTERVLVPPRVDLEAAIRLGMFDDRNRRKIVPESAFPGVSLNWDGSFPAGRRNIVSRLLGNASAGDGESETFFCPNSAAEPPHIPYLPDPWAKRLIIGIYRAADDQLLRIEYFDYYDAKHIWPNCRHLMLRAEAVIADALPRSGVQVIFKDNVLVIRLAAGMKVRLRCFHEIDEEMLGASGILECMSRWLYSTQAQDCRTLLGLPDRCAGELGATREQLIRCLSRWHERFPFDLRPYLVNGYPAKHVNLVSFSMLNPSRELEITHAVPIPAGVLRFVDSRDLEGRASVTAPASHSTITKWFDLVRPAINATKAVFKGDIEFHRASTSAIECIGEWEELDDETAPKLIRRTERRIMLALSALRGVLTNPNPLHDRPAAEASDRRSELAEDNDCLLLNGTRTATGRTVNEDIGCLTKDFEFGDTKAKLVKFTLRGTSRYVEDFSDEAAARRATEEAVTSRWVMSSRAPDVVKPAYVVPLFDWEYENAADTVRHKRTGGKFRIWLERPWYSSGDGELLALVCWPPDLFRPRSGAYDYAADAAKRAWGSIRRIAPPPELERLYTGWGLDPIWEQGDDCLELIPAGAFANRHVREPVTAIPPQFHTGYKNPEQYRVALALYKPQYDETARRWYADVHIDPPRGTHFPFVRLAMARYQPNAFDSCKLSEVVASEFTQLTPTRTATVHVERSKGRNSRVRVSVGGARAAIPDISLEPIDHLNDFKRTRMVMRIEEHDAELVDTESLKPFFGQVDYVTQLNAGRAWIPMRMEQGPELMTLNYNVNQMLWDYTVDVEFRSERFYSVYLEEREPMLQDRSPEQSLQDNKYRLDKERVVYADRILIYVPR